MHISMEIIALMKLYSVDYKGKRYFVSLAEERVEFIGIIKEDE